MQLDRPDVIEKTEQQSKMGLHLPIQRLVQGFFYKDHAVRASICLHVMIRLARGRGSLSWGTYDALTSCMPLKLIDIIPLLRDAQSFLRG